MINDRRRFKFRFMRDAVVDSADAIPNGGGLPAELVGRTPEEIATYYAEREQTILANARRMVTEAREGNPTNVPNNTPANPTPPQRQPASGDTVTRAEFDAMTSAAQAGLIQMAQMTASTGRADWVRHLPEVRRIVEALPVVDQIRSDIWLEAYHNVRGRMTDTLISEARNQALGLEQPSPPPPAPTKPRVWTEGERAVIEGCEITPEMYADAESKLNSNYQPFTTDNRRR